MITATPHNSSPFISIPPWARMLILAYLFFYRLIFPAIAHSFSTEPSYLDVSRLLAETLYTFLLMVPFLFYRRDFGWLHPIIFPTLFSLLKGFFKNPLHLIAPLDLPLQSFAIQLHNTSITLRQLTIEELATTQLQYTLLLSFALICYYTAFFLGPRFQPLNNIQFRAPSASKLKRICLVIVGVSAVTTIGLVAMQGGLSQHLLALTRPRFETLGGLGYIIFIINAGTIALLVWAAYDHRAFLNPIFLASVVLMFICGVIANGSRGDAATFLMLLGMVWILHHRKIPYVAVASIGLVVFILFGAFGLIRRDHGADEVNWSIFSTLNYEAWLLSAVEEAQERQREQTSLAAFAGAQKHGLLLGKSYIGAVAFLVPRAIWPDKPRTSDTYNGILNYMGRSLDYEGRNIGGRPVSAEAEAFWNFHLVGVAIVFVAFGVFHSWLAQLMQLHSRNPAIWSAYLLLLVGFNGTAKTFTSSIREMIFLALILVTLGSIRHAARRARVILRHT